MLWALIQPDTDLGFLPSFLSESDSRPAAEQIDAAYQHGGGWQAFDGFTRVGHQLQYPGDPPLKPVAMTMLRDEKIFVYPYSWVMILQPDESFVVARID
jgi:hypothetical protein